MEFGLLKKPQKQVIGVSEGQVSNWSFVWMRSFLKNSKVDEFK